MIEQFTLSIRFNGNLFTQLKQMFKLVILMILMPTILTTFGEDMLSYNDSKKGVVMYYKTSIYAKPFCTLLHFLIKYKSKIFVYLFLWCRTELETMSNTTIHLISVQSRNLELCQDK